MGIKEVAEKLSDVVQGDNVDHYPHQELVKDVAELAAHAAGIKNPTVYNEEDKQPDETETQAGDDE